MIHISRYKKKVEGLRGPLEVDKVEFQPWHSTDGLWDPVVHILYLSSW